MTLAHQNAVTYAEIKKPAYPMYTVHYKTRQNMNFAGKMPKVVIEQWVHLLHFQVQIASDLPKL